LPLIGTINLTGLTNLNISNGLVLVKPDIVDATVHGIGLHAFADAHHYSALTGEVVAVGKGNVFYGREIDAMEFQSKYSDAVSQRASLLSSFSSRYDVPIEVEVGDKVIFDWKYALKEAPRLNEFLLVRYDDLYVRVRDMYPLNGILLVDFQEMKHGEIFDPSKLGRDMTCGEVVAEGCPVKGYLHSDAKPDTLSGLVGKTAYFKKYDAIPIEDSLVFSLGERPLARLHRKDVAVYV